MNEPTRDRPTTQGHKDFGQTKHIGEMSIRCSFESCKQHFAPQASNQEDAAEEHPENEVGRFIETIDRWQQLGRRLTNPQVLVTFFCDMDPD
jgi:hypothetical protein